MYFKKDFETLRSIQEMNLNFEHPNCRVPAPFFQVASNPSTSRDKNVLKSGVLGLEKMQKMKWLS